MLVYANFKGIEGATQLPKQQRHTKRDSQKQNIVLLF